MRSSRRALLASLAAFGALDAAGCARKRETEAEAMGLDTDKLAHGFAALAERAKPATFGLGMMTLARQAVWCSDETARFPMQSVFKAPLAAAALAEIDAGRLHFGEKLRITATDLSPPPSRYNAAFPPADGRDFLEAPAVDLIALAVEESDNTAADVIMGRIGGPGAVTAWLRSHNINDMRIDRYEREIQPAIFGLESFRPAWKDPNAWTAARSSLPPALREAAMAAYLAAPRDTTTCQAALNFLFELSAGNLLSPASTALLLRLMSGTATGAHRLRAGLPAGTRLAHKTGTAATDLGLTPATNEIGLATLPDGRRFAIAGFLSGSTATEAQRDGLFADAARLAVSSLT